MSIDIIQVFLDSVYVLQVTDLIESPVWLIVVAIVFPNGIHDLFLSIKPTLVGFPLI